MFLLNQLTWMSNHKMVAFALAGMHQRTTVANKLLATLLNTRMLNPIGSKAQTQLTVNTSSMTCQRVVPSDSVLQPTTRLAKVPSPNSETKSELLEVNILYFQVSHNLTRLVQKSFVQMEPTRVKLRFFFYFEPIIIR